MKKSFEIESDCLEIVRRIKDIDEQYFVKFDPEKHKFELHHRAQRNTYCLTFPFDQLDERAVSYVLKTRVQNSDEIFKSMEEENRKLRERQVKEILEDFKEGMHDC